MKRTRRREFVMTQAEFEDLEEKAAKACMTQSQLIRLLIAGYKPPLAPDEKFYQEMEALLMKSGELISLAKSLGSREKTDILLEEGLALRKLRQDIMRKYLTGERSAIKWQ